MKQAFTLLIALVLAACGSNNPQTEENILPDHPEEIEPTLIINLDTGDTLETGVAYPFSWESKSSERASNLMKSDAVSEMPFETYPYFSNIGNVTESTKVPFYLDSADQITPNDSTILPAREVVIEPTITKVKEPPRKKVLPSIYKDNAQYDIRYFGTDQGLPSNNVSAIEKDERGFIWIATDKGLCRYDGRFIVNYTIESGLPENHIQCLTIDDDQNIWMGTREQGVVKFDGETFTHFNLDSISIKKVINNITVDKNNNLWGVMEFGGIFCYSDSTFKSWQAPQGIYVSRPTTSVTVDNDNRKWITGYGVGLYVFDSENNIFKQNKAFNPMSTYMNNCTIDKKGNPVFSHWGPVISYAQGDSLSKFTFKGVPESIAISQTEIDKDGGFWCSGYGSGIYHWIPGSDKVEFFGTDQGMSSEYVMCLYMDEMDGIWAGTGGGGLCHIQRKSFTSLNEYNGLRDNMVYEITEGSGGELYYATATGVIKHDTSGFTKFLKGSFNPVDVIVKSDGAVWIPASNSGPILIKNGKYKHFGTFHGAPHNPTCLDTTSDGHVWVGGMNHPLCEFNDTTLFQYSFNNGLCVQYFNDMCITDSDEFWLGSKKSGVVHIDKDSITYITMKEGLQSNVINHIGEDKSGRIWICTEAGLNYMEGDEVKTASENNPVFKRSIMGIIQDDVGRYWITTNEGLITLIPKIAIQEDWNLENFNIHLTDKTNGLHNTNFLENSIYIDSKNRLMAGSNGGLITLDLNEVSLNRIPPSTSINSIGINGKQLDYRNGADELKGIEFSSIVPFSDYPVSMTLPHDMNHLTFEFSGFNWSDPHSLSLFYYLEGYETNWNKSREENIADYRNLSYGDYVFHLKSVNRDGLESEEFTYEFSILRPWWHTWWARIMYVLIFSGAIYLLIRRRTAALKQQQEVLESEVARATIKITAQKEQAERQKNQIEKAHDELNIKNKEVLDSINYAKRIQTAILPSEKILKEKLGNSFILYKPKDIVAGDFYWLEPSNGSVFFAAGDCTGHGVPGAMVSVICNNALNRSVRVHKLDDPAKILDRTRQIVLEEFGQSEEGVNDGMDIALCKLTAAKKDGEYALEYAGAHNPLWIVRKDNETEEGYRLEEIKADKQPIGKFHDPKPFTKHELTLKKGECFYIFTDGFSDQFGGEKGKKFKTANFKRLIVKVQGHKIQKQGELLENMFEEWKSDFEQLDDVCVIGVQL